MANKGKGSAEAAKIAPTVMNSMRKESLDRYWTHHYEGAALRYLHDWID
jgi:hypothetical protein